MHTAHFHWLPQKRKRQEKNLLRNIMLYGTENISSMGLCKNFHHISLHKFGGFFS